LGIIKKAWPFLSIVVLTVVYERLGVILLRMFQSDSDVGYFASAERLLVPFSAMFLAFIVAVFPALAKISPDQSLERDTLARRFLRVLLVLILPTATLVYLYGADIIILLYGADFKEAIAVLTILAWVIALRGFNAFLSMFSISADLQTRLSMLKLSALLVFITLSLAFIPRYSYLGLAYSIVASEIFLAVVMYWSFRRKNLLPGLFSMLWRPSICCLVIVVVTMFSSTLPLGFRLLISLATLVTTAFLTGAVKRHDLSYLVRIASSRRAPESD
jgi:O-antigen/teichoic acid export membrane protein